MPPGRSKAVAFESVMADVKKVVNFDTPDQFGQMSKDVLLMSTRIPMAADGIGAIVAAAGQAGIARDELLRFAEDAPPDSDGAAVAAGAALPLGVIWRTSTSACRSTCFRD